MSSDSSAEQVELRRKGRQRLVGAITLALLAAVFIPMLLDPEPRVRRADPVLAIPTKEDAPPLPAPSGPAGDAAPLPSPAGPSPEPARAVAEVTPGMPRADAPRPEPEARKVVEPKAAEFKGPAPRVSPTVEPAPKVATAAAPKLEGFAVQVGAFKDEVKLAQAREKLTAARLAHYTERLQAPSGELTRLRVGPFPTREAADRATTDVKRAGLDGRVVPLP
jgi:DedD protein